MFQGIPREAFDFLLGIRLNNNEAYYKDHLEDYEKTLKGPLRELCRELAPVIQGIDPRLDVRPGSVMSRLRRDTRFTRDKAPFRDNAWLGWRYPGERRSEGFHMWWGFSPEWMGWGGGSYSLNRPLMDALRAKILSDPEEVRALFSAPGLSGRYVVYGEVYKKMSVPDAVPQELKELYRMKYFGISRDAPQEEWARMQSPDFVGEMVRELTAMAPLMNFMRDLSLQVEAPQAEEPEKTEADAPQTGKLVVHAADEFEF